MSWHLGLGLLRLTHEKVMGLMGLMGFDHPYIHIYSRNGHGVGHGGDVLKKEDYDHENTLLACAVSLAYGWMLEAVISMVDSDRNIN